MRQPFSWSFLFLDIENILPSFQPPWIYKKAKVFFLSPLLNYLNVLCEFCELFVLLGSQSEDASEGRGFLDNINIFSIFSSKPKQNKPKPRRPSYNYHPPSYHPPSYQPPSYKPPSYQPQSYEPPPYQPPPSTTEGPVEVIIKGQHVFTSSLSILLNTSHFLY